MRRAGPLMVFAGLALSCAGGGDLVRGTEPDWRQVAGRYRMTYQSLDWNEGITLGARPALLCLGERGRYRAFRFPIWEWRDSKWRLAGRQRLAGRWHGLVVGVLPAPRDPTFWGVQLDPHPTPRGGAAPADPLLAHTDRGFELRFSYGDPRSPEVMIFTQVDAPCRTTETVQPRPSAARAR